MPTFSGRVTHVPNAGLALAQVTPADTGNYTVQVTGRNSAGDQMALRRSASARLRSAVLVTWVLCWLCVCVCVRACVRA